MNTAKVYYDINGNPCTIFQMIKREPEWVASVFQKMETDLAKHGWISVGDGLPDYGVPVWVSAVGQGATILARDDDELGWLWGSVYSHWWSLKDGWQCDFETDDDYGWVTHWMPLPKPL
jgi:hypothetical protein